MTFPAGFVNVPRWLHEQIQADHVERMHALDAGLPVAATWRRNLLRLRLAVLLGILEGRTAPDDEDWHLAGTLADSSDAVVEMGARLRAEQARAASRFETDRHARHAVASASAVEADRARKTARKVARIVQADPGITRTTLRRRLSAGRRDVLDDALELAVAVEWIVERSEPGQGNDRHAIYPARSASEGEAEGVGAHPSTPFRTVTATRKPWWTGRRSRRETAEGGGASPSSPPLGTGHLDGPDTP